MRVLSLVSLVVLLGVLAPAASFGRDVNRTRPAQERFCFDFTNTLPSEVVDEVDRLCRAYLYRPFDIDCVIAVVPDLNGASVEEYAVELFDDWRIGEKTHGAKGILLLIVRSEQKAKIEIGYDLEHIYTDMYVAQVEREIIKEFFELGNWEHGFLSSIENFTNRVEMLREKGELVRELSGEQDGFLSGGAGATVTFDFASALGRPLVESPREIREYFGAQPTPMLAYERYMELQARQIRDKTLDIYSDETKEFWRHWPSTSGQARAEAESFSGIPMRALVINDRYAVVRMAGADTPEKIHSKNPYFFVKSGKGWQIDTAIMGRAIGMTNSSGGWSFRNTGHPFFLAFPELRKTYHTHSCWEHDKTPEAHRLFHERPQGAAWFGFYYTWSMPYERDAVKRAGFSKANYVIDVIAGSPAEMAGLRKGDVIVTDPYSSIVVPVAEGRIKAGDTVEVTIVRGLKETKTIGMIAREWREGLEGI